MKCFNDGILQQHSSHTELNIADSKYKLTYPRPLPSEMLYQLCRQNLLMFAYWRKKMQASQFQRKKWENFNVWILEIMKKE